MPANDDCPVCNGRKIIITRDYADCERDEPCPHCSEREHCASCISLRAENARLREGLKKAARTLQYYATPMKMNGREIGNLSYRAAKALQLLAAALKEPGV